MQYTSTILLSAAGLVSTVSAHGFILTPRPRLPGPAMLAACGQQVFNNQEADHLGNIQGMLQVASNQPDFRAADCNVWLCKGYQFDDNAANVQSWTPGQRIPFTFVIAAPHVGHANVSIIKTDTNTIVGNPLLTYDDFANNAYPTQANQTSFSITIPTDLGSTCADHGACVIQHFWDARSVDQTYESCVDFTVGSSGAAAPAPPAATPAPGYPGPAGPAGPANPANQSYPATPGRVEDECE